MFLALSTAGALSATAVGVYVYSRYATTTKGNTVLMSEINTFDISRLRKTSPVERKTVCELEQVLKRKFESVNV